MTDEVARLVLRNNYLQTLALSLSERRGSASSASRCASCRRSNMTGGSTARRDLPGRRDADRARRAAARR
jgi:NAD-specific glutamate dehydrogenase